MQVYYAIGNIYLAQKDTVRAISAYEKGNEKATRSGIEKGVLLLHLGDLYWELEKYGDAQRCYGEAIGLLDKERPDYKQLSDRSKVLDELVPYTDGIYLQDSLQVLAKMDEKSRNEAIDRVIDELKKKEKEERDKEAEAAVQAQQQKYGNQTNNQRQTPVTPSASNNKQQTFYFYNAQAVLSTAVVSAASEVSSSLLSPFTTVLFIRCQSSVLSRLPHWRWNACLPCCTACAL